MNREVDTEQLDGSQNSQEDESPAARHRLAKRHLSGPSFCNYCREFVWGIGRQAYSCAVCSYTIHKRCLKALSMEAPHTCQPTSIPELFDSTLPTSFEPSSSSSSSTSHPSSTLSPTSSSTSSASSSSSNSIIRMDKDETQRLFEMHHWVESNVKVGNRCVVCDETISVPGIHSLHCSRCRESVHAECRSELAEHCSPAHRPLLWMGYPEPTSTPLIVFINSRSAGKQGETLMKKLTRYLGPNQVFDLAQGGPGPGLAKFRHVPGLRVLACGGDGTAAWLLEAVDKANFATNPAAGVIPLGTGNDLARTLGWGGGYEGEKISPILSQLERAETVLLDRWRVNFTSETGELISTHIMNNYFSVGVDARIALQFHELRETMPALCSTRLANKILYANYGLMSILQEALSVSGDNNFLNEHVKLQVDGHEVELPPSVAGISVINLPSYMGGCSLWGSSEEVSDEDGRFREPAIDDGILEVVGLCGTMHMASIQINLANAVRIAQGRKVRLEWLSSVECAMQVDGEPKRRGRCVVEIEIYNQARMLKCREAADVSVGAVDESAIAKEAAEEEDQASEPESKQARLTKDEEVEDEDEDEDEDSIVSALNASPLLSMIPAMLSPEQYSEMLAPYKDIYEAMYSLFSNGEDS